MTMKFEYPHPLQPTPEEENNLKWTMAMVTALGADSGVAVPIVPDADAFRRLFHDLRRRALLIRQRQRHQQRPVDPGCACGSLSYGTDMDMATLRDDRHHPACPLHVLEKHPRIFYYEEAENCWTPAPNDIDCILSLEVFNSGDVQTVEFKRIDMTDHEFYNLAEV